MSKDGKTFANTLLDALVASDMVKDHDGAKRLILSMGDKVQDTISQHRAELRRDGVLSQFSKFANSLAGSLMRDTATAVLSGPMCDTLFEQWKDEQFHQFMSNTKQLCLNQIRQFCKGQLSLLDSELNDAVTFIVGEHLNTNPEALAGLPPELKSLLGGLLGSGGNVQFEIGPSK